MCYLQFPHQHLLMAKYQWFIFALIHDTLSKKDPNLCYQVHLQKYTKKLG